MGAGWGAGAAAKRCTLIRDELRIGKADGNVVSSRSKLLEVARFVDLDKSFVVLAAIQSVGLQPLLTGRDPISRRSGYDAVPSGWHIRDDRLTGQRGQSGAVSLILRADRDHARDARIVRGAIKSCVRICRDRARVLMGDRIDGSRQGVRQRLVELDRKSVV